MGGGRELGGGEGQVKMLQSLLTIFVFPFYLVFLLGCCKPLSIFQSSDKTDSDIFAFFFS